MNVALSEAKVTAACKKAEVSISAIETLPAGGTHLVTTTGEGAETMRDLLANHLIEGRVRRFGYMPPPIGRQEVPAQLSPNQKRNSEQPSNPAPWFRVR